MYFTFLTNLGKMRTIFGYYASTRGIFIYFHSYLLSFPAEKFSWKTSCFMLQMLKNTSGHLILDIFAGAGRKKSLFCLSQIWCLTFLMSDMSTIKKNRGFFLALFYCVFRWKMKFLLFCFCIVTWHYFRIGDDDCTVWQFA